ncbi:ribose-phosphate pyrophosphokinase [candidate division KSB1 bacterium]|nr:ribose-phosphate pyrophosphokinase [candidate division KSB1 bacterium]
MKVFSGSANQQLAKQIVEYLGIPLGQAELTRFSDGELSATYNESIRGKDLFIIQPTCPPSDNMIELLLMIDAAKRASADRITAVIPYFGYARQDRKDRPRVSLSAKLIANMISTAGADRILTMDLHSPSIQGFFDIPFDHLYAYTIFVEYLSSNNFNNPVVVAPDVGSSKRARAYANRLNTDFAIVDKRRLGPNEIDSVTLIGDVEGRDVILVDDIIDTAGTLCSAAELLKENKAHRVLAACTHPILSRDAVEKICKSSISKVLVLDTVPIPKEKQCEKIEVLSSASLFGEAIKRIHHAESISSLFDNTL